MDEEARRAVVAALLRLAGSDDYRDRADAGRAMAGFAASPEAQAPLRRLLLDGGDTYVTLVTTEALLRRHDPAGLALVAEALANASTNRADWMYTAIQWVFGIYADERDAAVRTCDALGQDAGPGLREGIAQLRAALTNINPVLHPPREP